MTTDDAKAGFRFNTAYGPLATTMADIAALRTGALAMAMPSSESAQPDDTGGGWTTVPVPPSPPSVTGTRTTTALPQPEAERTGELTPGAANANADRRAFAGSAWQTWQTTNSATVLLHIALVFMARSFLAVTGHLDPHDL